MFSFFKSSKKHSPDEQPLDDPIPGPDPVGSEQDGFTILNPPSTNNQYQQSSGGLYPTFGPTGNLLSGGLQPGSRPTTIEQPFHYLNGVPFKLSTELSSDKNNMEVARMQVDEILAFLTKTDDFQSDYEFRLERTIVAQ